MALLLKSYENRNKKQIKAMKSYEMLENSQFNKLENYDDEDHGDDLNDADFGYAQIEKP